MVRLHRIDEEGKSFNDVSYANYRAYRDGSIGVADLTGSALVSISMRTTGMPVSACPPTEPTPYSFQTGCGPAILASVSRFSASRAPP